MFTRKISQILAIILLSSIFLTACSPEEESKIPRSNETIKEVEVFSLDQKYVDITFSKSGIAKSTTIASISAETSARITEIHKKVGDKVKKGDLIVTLGDSASTSIADIQSETANQSLEIARQSADLLERSSAKNIEIATNSVNISLTAYQNALQNLQSAKNIYRDQRENLLLTIDTAEQSADSAEEIYDELDDAIEDLEDEIDDLEDEDDEDNEDTIDQLKATLRSTKIQFENAKISLESAENSVEQTELSLNILDENYKSQNNQLELAATSAYHQYLNAVAQTESAVIGGQLQTLNSEGQTIQADSSAQISEINRDLKHIKAPIDGVITSLSAEEGNLASPGIIIAKVENQNSLSINVSLNSYEAGLVEVGDKVKIIADDESVTQGEIVSISPSLNERSQKIDLEISIDKKKNITPGSFVKIDFTAQSGQRIFIPLNSISGIDDENKTIKIVNDENQIEIKKIRIGKIIGEYVEVVSGLNGREQIVLGSTTFVDEGDAVKIIN